MYNITDLKKNTLLQLDGKPYRVVEYNQKQLGRGGSIVNTKLKNLLDGSVLDKTFKGSDKIEPAHVEHAKVQFLYADGQDLAFMNTKTFDQFTLDREDVGAQADFLTEGMEVDSLSFQGRVISVELPKNVVQEVVSADPNVKGDTVGAALKNCVTETGVTVQVPMFINPGDRIRIDTRTGEYLERER